MYFSSQKCTICQDNFCCKIFFSTKNRLLSFAPPKEELTLHVRRDKKEHPFLEELYDWGNNFYGYAFTNIDPRQVSIPKTDTPEVMLENLGTVAKLAKPFQVKKYVEL